MCCITNGVLVRRDLGTLSKHKQVHSVLDKRYCAKWTFTKLLPNFSRVYSTDFKQTQMHIYRYNLRSNALLFCKKNRTSRRLSEVAELQVDSRCIPILQPERIGQICSYANNGRSIFNAKNKKNTGSLFFK